MKVLCIRGNPRRNVHAGQVYEQLSEYRCGCPRQQANKRSGATIIAINVHTGYGFKCSFCGTLVPGFVDQWAPKDHFVPIDNDKLNVTMDEVRDLYQPTPRRELIAG